MNSKFLKFVSVWLICFLTSPALSNDLAGSFSRWGSGMSHWAASLRKAKPILDKLDRSLSTFVSDEEMANYTSKRKGLDCFSGNVGASNRQLLVYGFISDITPSSQHTDDFVVSLQIDRSEDVIIDVGGSNPSVGSTIEFLVDGRERGCGPKFNVGESYLVDLRVNEDGDLETNRFSATKKITGETPFERQKALVNLLSNLWQTNEVSFDALKAQHILQQQLDARDNG